jgi:electron transport complex protein RnfC
MGSDRQLIETLTGKEVPSDCRAADVGVIVNNVGTANAVHRAIRLGEPMIRRLVTINGGAVWQPGNVLAPLGTLASDLLAFAGLKSEPARLLMGGPMMGAVLPHATVPTIKGTAGFLALNDDEIVVPEAGPCIRCGSCTSACPIGLLPLEMAANVRIGNLAGAASLGLSDCIACGCCAYICPSHIPLVQYFTHAKGELWSLERGKLRLEASKRLVAERAARLEREAKEKAMAAAKRKAERAAQKAAAAAEAAARAERSEANESSEIVP